VGYYDQDPGHWIIDHLISIAMYVVKDPIDRLLIPMRDKDPRMLEALEIFPGPSVLGGWRNLPISLEAIRSASICG
jgi:hypothetical protein